ncbi:MAG: hypothetical protein IH609_00590 [Dehalococcoidia bacterium]|nr:hypothetical protein [Dehalococcoidia bacterium]
MEVVTRRKRDLRETAAGLQGVSKVWLKPTVWGIVGAGLLMGSYLGIISFAQDWAHARDQLATDRWFVGVVTAGFGTQVALFVYLRSLHTRTTTGAMAASTGTSSAAMLACCAHHLADALPLVGLSGAAVFLNDFKGPIMWTGIVMNGLGIAYLGWKIRQQRSLIVRLTRPLEAATPVSSR